MNLFTITRADFERAVHWPGAALVDEYGQREDALAQKGGADRAVGIKVTVPW